MLMVPLNSLSLDDFGQVALLRRSESRRELVLVANDLTSSFSSSTAKPMLFGNASVNGASVGDMGTEPTRYEFEKRPYSELGRPPGLDKPGVDVWSPARGLESL